MALLVVDVLTSMSTGPASVGKPAAMGLGVMRGATPP
jgi:hypothetical protein